MRFKSETEKNDPQAESGAGFQFHGFTWLCADMSSTRSRARSRRWDRLTPGPSAFEREDGSPVALHIDYDPAVLTGLVQSTGQPAEESVVVVGILASGICVVDDQSEARPRAGGRPFEHLEVAIRVAERHERA